MRSFYGWHFLLIAFLSLNTGIFTRALHAQDQNCRRSARGSFIQLVEDRVNSPAIHASVTERSSFDIIAAISERPDPVTTITGKKVNVLQLFLKHADSAIHSAHDPFLSLGEGNATLISGMIGERMNWLQAVANAQYYRDEPQNADHIIAVDVAYPAHKADGTITDIREAVSDSSASGLDHYLTSTLHFIQKYPKNYRSQLFQNLDLRKEDGTRWKFKMIFSNASMGSVTTMSTEKEAREMFDRILDHLDPAGVVLIHPAPFGSLDQNVQKRKAFFNYLEELRKSGKISDYNADYLNPQIRETQRVPVVLIIFGPKAQVQ